MGVTPSPELRRLARNATERQQVLGLVATGLLLASVACLGTLSPQSIRAGLAVADVAHGPHSLPAPGLPPAEEQQQAAAILFQTAE